MMINSYKLFRREEAQAQILKPKIRLTTLIHWMSFWYDEDDDDDDDDDKFLLTIVGQTIKTRWMISYKVWFSEFNDRLQLCVLKIIVLKVINNYRNR